MLVFTPIYGGILGLEAMGLVLLWTTVRSFLTLLDFGMSTTLNREIAAARASDQRWDRLWSVFRTLETLSWSIAIGSAIVFGLIAPLAVHWWLNLKSTDSVTATTALALMGVAASCQLPTILYQGGLTGLERQVAMNRVVIVCSLFRDAGAIAALKVFPSTVVTFFAWQAAISLVQCIALRVVLFQSLPSHHGKGQIQMSLLHGLARFTAGTAMISVTVMFIGLADRLVVTKLVPLASVGVYSYVQTAAGAILVLVSPLTTAAFPRFVALTVSESMARLVSLYHEFAQIIAIAVFPMASLLVVFSSEVLYVWTGKPEVAAQGHIALSLVAGATALNALLYLPLQAQLASGWTSLTLSVNAVSVVLYVPVLILFVRAWGIEGAGAALLLLMAAQVMVIPILMHRRILTGRTIEWYGKDVLVPMVPSLVLGVLVRATMSPPSARLSLAGWLGVYWLILLGATLAFTPLARNRIIGYGSEAEPMPSSPPKVTIGMPSYNKGPYIAAAIESILDQTWQDFEFVISDDCSSDTSVSICERYAAEDPRIRFVSQPTNLGMIDNFNFVLEQARGELFMWFSADDRVDSTWLEICVAGFGPKTSISFGRIADVNVDGSIKRRYPVNSVGGSLWRRVVFLYWRMHSECNYLHGLAKTTSVRNEAVSTGTVT